MVTPTLQTLPEELITHVMFISADMKDVVSLARASRRFNTI
jgi:hypothetical protein